MAAAVHAVFNNVDVALQLLQHLSAGDVARAAVSCSALAHAAKQLPPRVLLVDSQAAKFFEANFASGSVFEVGKAHRGRYSVSFWATGAAVSPYNGDIFVSAYQDAGLLRFRAGSLAYRRIEYSSRTFCLAPEGITFGHNSMYCANVMDSGSILRIRRWNGTKQQVLPLGDLVPWMLVFGPDGALYVSVDKQYEAASSYGNPAEYDCTGSVLRITVSQGGQENGTMGSVTTFVECGLGGLKRPCGLCFDSAGYLYVASLSDQVLKFAGPQHEDAGQLKGVFVDTLHFGLSHPYDIRWCARGLVVTTHAADMDRRHGDARAAISLFGRDGSLLRSLTCNKLRHPNTIVTC